MIKCGLLGERLAHSFSPQIHAELGDYEYRLFEKKPEELEEFLRYGDFDGINVTIPYKKAVITSCSELSDAARAIGSVNTLLRRADGSLYGDNTDYFGFCYLFKKIADGIDGKALVLGSGGTSLTVRAVLRDMGIEDVVNVSRVGAVNYGNIGEHRSAAMIINTTPVGMFPGNGFSPIADLEVFADCRAVIDLIYNPARTELLMQAEELGIPCIGGLAMLVAQAKRAAEVFTGKAIADNAIESIARKISAMTQNIILIGMPGCGKSSVGAELAGIMGRRFADSDDLIEETAGKPIPAIFEQDGEDAFRKLESQALQELCKQSGLVIATGGGAVTRAGNRRVLKQNGTIIFLDRDIGELPVSGRPLSRQAGIEVLAAERLPLYAAWSDYTVPVTPQSSVSDTAMDIRGRL